MIWTSETEISHLIPYMFKGHFVIILDKHSPLFLVTTGGIHQQSAWIQFTSDCGSRLFLLILQSQAMWETFGRLKNSDTCPIKSDLFTFVKHSSYCSMKLEFWNGSHHHYSQIRSISRGRVGMTTRTRKLCIN